MSSRPRTLFQTWGSRVTRTIRSSSEVASGAGQPQGLVSLGGCAPEAVEVSETDPPEADDEVLLVAVYEAERRSGSGENPASPGALEDCGFCPAAGAVWIYPTNYPVRDYQLRISEAALSCNTLVCLPTGLGKTFIAAVVMYNFYRWFPSGKVAFMAPTKPLVSQQIEACSRVMGIPQAHMAEMTGSTQAFIRKEIWHKKRVLFLTPQVMINDLSRGACPAVKIKCLVIDEAHKALGNYAYCQVVRELVKYTKHFRILALSATPGNDTKAVQQVVSNLLIGQIELRSEDSSDILPFTHERRIEKLVVPLGEELVTIQNTYIQILETFASRLIRVNVLMRQDIPNLTKFQIILARDLFRKKLSPDILGGQQGIIEGDFAICISLYHGYELLQQMGMRSLYIFLCGIMDGTKSMTRTRNELSRNEQFMQLFEVLGKMFSERHPNQRGPNDKKFIYSHPKLKKLEEVVVEHFRTWKDQNTSEKKCDTRVMIFSSFRDSVQEIAEMLQHQPEVRVMTFVGHASGKSTKGLTQKEQLEVVKRFRDGGYNTLVSTCVGEEGLDIGEVDLIICFDAQKSPVRLVQRMGRTGRKREGRIVIILTEGREENAYNRSQSCKRSIYKAISGNSKTFHFYQGSPRMIPDGIYPKLHKMFITQEIYERAKQSKMCQKSSVNGKKQCKSRKAWSLTEEEFRLWNKLYRLREGDEFKEIILPKTKFESLQDDEDLSNYESRPGSYQLSLSEWRVWQNCPFPTHQVDHSDRCYHFISIMEMIDEIRNEEDECSYELKLKPYLQIEDISSTSNVLRNKHASSASANTTTLQKPLFKRNMKQSCSSSLIVFDEEFKSNKNFSSKVKAPKEMTEEQFKSNNNDNFSNSLITEVNSVVSCNFSEVPQVAKVPLDIDNVANTNTAHGQLCELLVECSPIDKSESSFVRNHVAPSYNDFTDGKSISSSMFYLPEDPDLLKTASQLCDKCFILTKETLTNVERFLSESPPHLDELYNLKDEIIKKSSFKNLSEDISNYFMSTSFVYSPLCSEINSPKLCSSKSNQLSQINSDRMVDRSSSDEPENEIHTCTQNDKTFDDHTQINGSPKRCLVKKKTGEVCKTLMKKSGIEQDQERKFSEVTDTEFNQVSSPYIKNNSKYLSVSDEAFTREVVQVSPFCISDECLLNFDSETKIPLIQCTKFGASLEDIEGVGNDNFQNDVDIFDCSKELFSVNFDLGFSSPDSDEEDSELAQDINKNGHLKVDASGSHVNTTQIATDYGPSKESTPNTYEKSNTRRSISTPSKLQNHNPSRIFSPLETTKEKEFESPGNSSASSISLPLGENVMSTPLGTPNPIDLFSTVTQEIFDTSTTKKKVNLRGIKKTLSSTFEKVGITMEKTESNEQINLFESCHYSDEGNGIGSEDDVVFQRKSKKVKRDHLKSPKVGKSSDIESPVCAVKKCRRLLSTSESSSDESIDFHKSVLTQDDFQNNKRNPPKGVRVLKRYRNLKHEGRQFLDEEAEISEDAEGISSDESEKSENEQDSLLVDFLNDGTQLSQVLNDSEMKSVYLQSVRSPLVGNMYKMVHKKYDSMNIFSQIPEQDESYSGDSFCVSDEEEHPINDSTEEVCIDFNLLNEDSFVDGRKKYHTRRLAKLKRIKAQNNFAVKKKKVSRIIVPDDSSEEENIVNVNDKTESAYVIGGSICSKTEKQDDCLQKAQISGPLKREEEPVKPIAVNNSITEGQKRPLNIKYTVSEDLDENHQCDHKIRSLLNADSLIDCKNFTAQHKINSDLVDVNSKPLVLCTSSSNQNLIMTPTSFELPEKSKRTCILVDNREISSGSEIISSLRTTHGLEVEVCPLSGCDYIVSNRMAVERKSQSEMTNSMNRSKLIEKIQYLQNIFERICVIVEKDREKKGAASKVFQRTKSYDSLLSALIGAGIRILFSSCQKETAELIKELTLVEKRKNVGIYVPIAVKDDKRDIFRFYLSIPNISYVTALNMCHHFSSVKKMTNSSLEEISLNAQVSHQKAEEIYHYIHYAFDMQMLPDIKNGRLK
ncbi:Fanconi anemia group M protein [Gracilinanus agilis]|uniref:Fanconi anemia group M protein n=1 Tax=Gracilinanus agilis TaxID=191870 RepID=UPI001CFD6FDD|nr:Fanconi anemia group M protein [Gracilinanus agilis]